MNCQHGHTRKNHPNCFIFGSDKPKWYTEAKKNNEVGILDIETTGRDARFSIMISWAIKPLNGKTVWMVSDKKTILSDKEDTPLLEGLVNEMLKYEYIVTYYGSRFDIPFARARCSEMGVDFPAFGSIYHLDMYFAARRNLRVDRKSLELIGDIWGFEDKTHLKPRVWRAAGRGNKEALSYVLNHNIKDVILLEKVYKKLEPYFKGARTPL